MFFFSFKKRKKGYQMLSYLITIKKITDHILVKLLNLLIKFYHRPDSSVCVRAHLCILMI